MINYLDTPLFGITITVIVFSIISKMAKKIKTPLFNTVAISMTLIIIFLKAFNIDIELYDKGGDIISFLLGPATVMLAIPIYKKRHILKANLSSTIIGIFMGSLSGIVSVIILSKLLLSDDIMMLSLIPKSVTSAIAIDLSTQIGGEASITMAFVVATGVLGGVIGPNLFKLFKIDNKNAKGVALGTASHVLGTTKAMELGQQEGAMSSVAIGIAGLITVFIAPLVLKFVDFFW